MFLNILISFTQLINRQRIGVTPQVPWQGWLKVSSFSTGLHTVTFYKALWLLVATFQKN